MPQLVISCNEKEFELINNSYKKYELKDVLIRNVYHNHTDYSDIIDVTLEEKTEIWRTKRLCKSIDEVCKEYLNISKGTYRNRIKYGIETTHNIVITEAFPNSILDEIKLISISKLEACIILMKRLNLTMKDLKSYIGITNRIYHKLNIHNEILDNLYNKLLEDYKK